MKNYIFIILWVLLYFCSKSVLAINEDSLKIIQLNSQLELLQNEVKQIRVNQLNYKIENETIKESYSASLSTTQTVLTVVFSIATLISIGIVIASSLGYKSADKTKAEFSDKLNELNTQKGNFDTEYRDFIEKKDNFEKRIAKVEESNNELNKKILKLNLLDKAVTAYNNKEYNLSLNYIDTIGQQDELTISYKIKIFQNLGRENETIDLYHKMLNYNISEKKEYFLKLCEIFLSENNIEAYEELIETYSSILSSIEDITNIKYAPSHHLKIFHLYVKGLYFFKKKDLNNLQEINQKISTIPAIQLPKDTDIFPTTLQLDLSYKIMKGLLSIKPDNEIETRLQQSFQNILRHTNSLHYDS